MAKAHSTPLNDIAIIAANLKDRYKNGFPVLKEIVQNADDAQASSLIFGWSIHYWVILRFSLSIMRR